MPEKRKRLVIFAGRRRSMASVLMIWALAKRTPSVEIVGVVCPSEFNWKRIRHWYRRFGGKICSKVFAECGFRRLKMSGINEEHEVLRDRWREWEVSTISVSEICSQFEIPFRVVCSINSSDAVKVVEGFKPDYSVYSGAGILRDPILQAGRKVLNVHCGPLPAVRGMNAVEWSLFLGLTPEVTLHYIDKGIDTGRIVASRQFDVTTRESISRIRGRAILTGIDLLVDSLSNWESRKERENPPEGGKQYFSMSDTIARQLQDWIDQGKTPKRS